MNNTVPDLEKVRRPSKGRGRGKWEIYFLKESGAAELQISILPPELGGFPREPVHQSEGWGEVVPGYWRGIVPLP